MGGDPREGGLQELRKGNVLGGTFHRNQRCTVSSLFFLDLVLDGLTAELRVFYRC